MPDQVALIVHTCDRYELLYKGFEVFFNKYWDFNIDCQRYFATENKAAQVAGFINIQSGKGAWADRLAFLLKEKITEKYILYFQEDMWLNKPVNASFFNQLFNMAADKKWPQVKLHSSDVYKTTATDIFIEGFNIARLNNTASDFLMSHQVTLWEKDFLLGQLHKNEHPWRNERKGTARLKKQDPEIYQADYFAENGQRQINQNHVTASGSAYDTISQNGVLQPNVLPYIAALNGGHDDDKNYALKLQHNYDNGLTHDGLVKPRKVDIFKQAKNWLKGQ